MGIDLASFSPVVLVLEVLLQVSLLLFSSFSVTRDVDGGPSQPLVS